MSSKKSWWKKAYRQKHRALDSKKVGKNSWRAWTRRLDLEELEPRLAPVANLVYGEGTPPNTFDPAAIAAYAAGLVSTDFTLRAELDSGNFFWRLYGTGTDLLPIPAVQVLEYQITQATDLDVDITARRQRRQQHRTRPWPD